ncbi:MAG: branched-chain amino acid transaminase [Rickettsiaceae bacterium]|nr:branched-chain amino acid transaminase [Rickettsiaceae bacterium]
MFDDVSGYIWIDGEIVAWKDARIHIMTHSLHYASSVFEGLRCYKNKVLKALPHYQRMQESAKYLDYDLPYSPQELVDATNKLIELGKYNFGYIRAIAWCGTSKMTVSNKDSDIHLAIGIWESPLSYNAEVYENGIRMNLASWRRPHPSTAPVHSKAAGMYTISSMSKKSAELAGFTESLMLDYAGNIAEATSANIFLVIDGSLYTPVADCFLNGITRRTCIEIAKNNNIPIYESKLTLADLDRASEIFLTGTAVEILPVGTIEHEEKIWRFKPSDVTYKIRSEFLKIIDNL